VRLLRDLQLPTHIGNVLGLGKHLISLSQLPNHLLRGMPSPGRHKDQAFLPTTWAARLSLTLDQPAGVTSAYTDNLTPLSQLNQRLGPLAISASVETPPIRLPRRETGDKFRNGDPAQEPLDDRSATSRCSIRRSPLRGSETTAPDELHFMGQHTATGHHYDPPEPT
jgi:hypothetical protein